MGKPTIVFRADGNSNIGMGHFVRTLALAGMLNKDFYCVFAIQRPTDYQIQEINKNCHDHINLPDDNSHFQLFLEKLNGTEIIVLDNYYFDTNYQREIKVKGCKLVCVDDLHDKHYVADAVINHAIGIESFQFSTEKYTKLFLGFDYSLLRSVFLDEVQMNFKKQYSILIMMGGADPYNLTIPIINALSEIQLDLPFAVVYDGNKLEDSSRYVQYRNVSSEEVAKLMKLSVIGVLPSSSVAIEACACKLPFITGYFVNNQVDLYKSLISRNLAIDFGDFNQGVNNLGRLILKFYYDDEVKNLIIQNQNSLLDKQSRVRICSLFNDLSNGK